MTTPTNTTLEWSWLPTDATASPQIGQASAVSARPIDWPTLEARRIESPSTLTLALIGVGTLAVFRGVQNRLTRRAAAPAQPLIKPRRRAA